MGKSSTLSLTSPSRCQSPLLSGWRTGSILGYSQKTLRFILAWSGGTVFSYEMSIMQTKGLSPLTLLKRPRPLRLPQWQHQDKRQAMTRTASSHWYPRPILRISTLLTSPPPPSRMLSHKYSTSRTRHSSLPTGHLYRVDYEPRKSFHISHIAKYCLS